MANIEVYEWKKGSPRPGTVRKHRHDCIDILEVPPDGLPNVSDVVLITDPPGDEPRPFRVISREFLWTRISEPDPQTPQEYQKVWIHVRPLTEKEYEADPVTK